MRKNGFVFGLAYLLGALSALGLGSWQGEHTNAPAATEATCEVDVGLPGTVPEPIASESACNVADSPSVSHDIPMTCAANSATDLDLVIQDRRESNGHAEAPVGDGQKAPPSGVFFTSLVQPATSVDGLIFSFGSPNQTKVPLQGTITVNAPQAIPASLGIITVNEVQAIPVGPVQEVSGFTITSTTSIPTLQFQLDNVAFQPLLQGPFSSEPIPTAAAQCCNEAVHARLNESGCDNLGFDRRQLICAAIATSAGSSETDGPPHEDCASPSHQFVVNLLPSDVDVDALAPTSPSEDESKNLQALREKLVSLAKSKSELQSEKSLLAEIARIETETANLKAAQKIFEAQQALQKIIDEFPNSPAAQRAKSMLELRRNTSAKNVPGFDSMERTLPTY